MPEDSTQTRILRAAGPIFAEKGFRNSTVREICSAADVNLASVNYYFQDKDNLYLETVRFARQTQDNRYPYPNWESELAPEQKLRGFIETLLRRIMAMQDAQWPVRLMMNEVLHPTAACRQLVEQYFNPIFEKLLLILDQISGQELPGHLRKKLGFSVIGQCLFYRYSNAITSIVLAGENEDDFDLESLAAHISEFCLAAIKHGNWSESGTLTINNQIH